jgi:hypothetical protein
MLGNEGKKMATTVRLNDQEQENLRKKAVEINKVLIQKGKQPIRDSELIHIILDKVINWIDVDSAGNITMGYDA